MARKARGRRGRDTKDPEGVGSVLGTCKERERARGRKERDRGRRKDGAPIKALTDHRQVMGKVTMGNNIGNDGGAGWKR